MTEQKNEFKPFAKMPRLREAYVVTEKIDGTNGCVVIGEDGSVTAQSRNRIITPDQDNYGFASWVEHHAPVLREVLAPGHHFGEWWGLGVNRSYKLFERRFSLFNVSLANMEWQNMIGASEDIKLGPCWFVPVIGYGSDFALFDADDMEWTMREWGSYAAPGFMDPEGFVVWHERVGYMKHPFGKGK